MAFHGPWIVFSSRKGKQIYLLIEESLFIRSYYSYKLTATLTEWLNDKQEAQKRTGIKFATENGTYRDVVYEKFPVIDKSNNLCSSKIW